jgi:hypothetical protein
LQESPNLRALELALCARDVTHWCNSWCWTYDPRLNPATVPFDLFPKQGEFLAWLAGRESAQANGLVEKSRDMGVTWLCCLYALHGWLFRDGYKASFGSRKLDLVDRRGDPDSIFEKLRFLLHNLPPWMLPAGFSADEHDCEAKLINPANGSTITGEGGDNIGRGGRATIYFLDEAAYLEHPQSVDRSLSQTTRCRIDVSTPNGPGNPFAAKRHSGRVPVFTFHWRDDPRKGEAWYAAEKERINDPVIVAQELNIDYTASVSGITIPAAWVRAAVDLLVPRAGLLPVAGLDVAEEGDAANVLVPRWGPLVGSPLVWAQANTSETAYRAADLAERLGATILSYDCVGVGAGVRGALTTRQPPPRFIANPVNVGERPTLTVWPDGKTSQERFANLKAELWWQVRCRFERAFEFREKGVQHPQEDMISIPNHPQLIAELSLPLHFYTETGKIQIESKKAIRQRGVKSPDHAEGLVLSFAPLAPGVAPTGTPRPLGGGVRLPAAAGVPGMAHLSGWRPPGGGPFLGR